ncbi:MAG TPA: hypothetical protein VHQ87_06710 [Rhizobacter sp.]|nr:hypothetical protein [Rhizobacter sp.]
MSTEPESHATAAQRLALSRERIRQSMRATMPPPAAARPAGELPSWLAGLASMPVVAVVLDAVRGWWEHHPARLATLVASDTAKTLIRPVAQRHPIGLVVGALLVGALLAGLRPWRRLVKPAVFAGLAGLLPQIMSKVVAHVPMESWMSALSSLTDSVRGQRKDDAPAQAPHAASPPTATASPQPPASEPVAAPAASAVGSTPITPRPTTLH